MPMQQMQAYHTTSIWGFRASLHTESSDGVRIPGAEIPPLLEKVKFLGREPIRDNEETLPPGTEPRVGGSSRKEGWLSSGRGGAWVTDIGREKGRVVIYWAGWGI